MMVLREFLRMASSTACLRGWGVGWAGQSIRVETGAQAGDTGGVKSSLFVFALAGCGGSAAPATVDAAVAVTVDAAVSANACALAAATSETASASTSGCHVLTRDASACQAT